MKNSIAIALIFGFVGLSGCSSSKPTPECFKQPDRKNLSGAERAALDDARSRFGQRCRSDESQCEIQLTRNKDNEILVSVATVFPIQENGSCAQRLGDQDLAVYSSSGEFIRTVMTL
jgi:hypothetical protein